MSEKKYVLPNGMERAAWDAMDAHAKVHGPAVGCVLGSMCSLTAGLEAAIRWQAENPAVPTPEQGREIRAVWDHVDRLKDASVCDFVETICREWQRRMYLAPEPEVPEAVEDLMHKNRKPYTVDCTPEAQDQRILEAYRRGQKSTQQSGR